MRRTKVCEKFIIVMLCLTVLICFTTFLGNNVHAASGKNGAKLYTLKLNKTYKKYDITGDNKKDKLCISAKVDSEGYINKLTVKVNGKKVLKKVYSKEWDENNPTTRAYPQVKLVRLKNKKTLLYIHFSTRNGYYVGGWVYRYKARKMKLLLKTEKLVQRYANSHPDVYRCGERINAPDGNTLSFDVGSIQTMNDSETFKFKYKNGILVEV